MKNQQINLTNLADQPQLVDYQHKPIQNYGMSLLKNMGFDQSRGIGKRKNNQLAEIYVLKPRPKGQGLGAQTQQQATKQNYQIGDRILITQQQHKGLTGYINQKLGNDLFEIQLNPSKSIVKIAINNLKKISKTQMKNLQEQLQKEEGKQKTKKKMKWIVPQIRVKIIDPKSEHYLKKVIVTDLITNKQFQCRDENGKNITKLSEADVQTVIPKQGRTVLILKGKQKGQKAIVMDRKKSKGSVTVQTVQQLQIIKVDQDDLSQYIQL